MKLGKKQVWFVVIALVVIALLYIVRNNAPAGFDTLNKSYSGESFDDELFNYAEPVALEATLTRTDSDGKSMVVDTESQKVIQSASLYLHVDNVRETVDELGVLTGQWGGYIENSNVDRYGDSYSGYLTLRIPNERFDEAVVVLKDLSNYVISEYRNSEDVTEAYIDLEARLNNFRAQEVAYLEVMDRAESVEEILDVTDALSGVRAEIESLESRLQYYDSRVDFSSLSVSLEEDESVVSVAETWRPLSTIRDAFASWLGFLQNLVDDVIVVAIYGWPILVIVLLALMFRRRKRGKTSKK